MEQKTPTLYFANHECADFYYLSKFTTPDRYFLLRVPGAKPKLFVNSLEYGRALKDSSCEVVMIERGMDSVHLALEITKDYAEIAVPYDFPAGLYKGISAQKQVQILQTAALPEREFKTEQEKQWLVAANDVSKRCFDRIRQILHESTIGDDDVLVYYGKALTAELLHDEVKLIILRSQAFLDGEQIIAPHIQACDPHCSGSGVIRAHQSLVCDIFPRSRTRYFADMTRTFCKGQPGQRLREMHDLVLQVQQELIKMVRPGVVLNTLAKYAHERFDAAGFGRRMEDGAPCGFIHGLGHGVGVDIHEAPNYNERTPDSVVCAPGQVFSVEPGLYFLSVGGVRIEDCVYVTESGAEVISAYDYDWIVE